MVLPRQLRGGSALRWPRARRAAALVAVAMALTASTVLLLAGVPSRSHIPHCYWPRCQLTGKPSLELVVSHHSESLGWLPRALELLPPWTHVRIYSKGPDPPKGATQLPNVGRESHTFLHHIVTRYNWLSDVTLFVMGSADYTEPFWWKPLQLVDLVEQWNVVLQEGFYCGGATCVLPEPDFYIGAWEGSTFQNDTEDGAGLVPAPVRPFSAWFERYIAGAYPKLWCPTAMLAVARASIRQRPREFYEQLLSQLTEADNMEVGHYLERAWAAVFGAGAVNITASPLCRKWFKEHPLGPLPAAEVLPAGEPCVENVPAPRKQQQQRPPVAKAHKKRRRPRASPPG